MVATFSNPRLSALPCERMRGCSFAENFITEAKMEENFATISGAGHSVNRGFVASGAEFITYDKVSQPDGFSVVIRFSTSLDHTNGTALISNHTPAGNGFKIHLSSTGGAIKASYKNAGGWDAVCDVDVDYSDGEIHTVTYVVDMDGGTQHLYVDALDSDEQTASIDEEIGTTGSVLISGGSGNKFTGTIYKARIFNSLLTEAEHDLYHAGDITAFWQSKTAAYRCDSFCNDSVGHYIWDRTTNLNDMDKGDRSDTDTFPTFDTDKYSFDLVDDYVGGLPSLGSAYTTSAALSTPQLPYPTIQQDNDTTLTALLTSSGQHWGYLHNMTLHSKQLTQLELYHAEYTQLYLSDRGRASRAYARLINEDVCKLAVFPGSDYYIYRDYSLHERQGQATLVTRDGLNGCSFPSATSNILFEHDSHFQMLRGTISLYGTFDSPSSGCYVDSDLKYKLRYSAGGTNYIYFSGSKIVYDLSDDDHIAVTFAEDAEPRFYVNGEYIGNGDAVVSPNDSDTDDVTVGNSTELNQRSTHAIKQVLIADDTLTDEEIYALYESAQIIGATNMETGNRVDYAPYTSAVAVDYDVDPGGPFQLIDIIITIDIAATSAGSITVSKVMADATKVVIDTIDPVATAQTVVPLRYDLRFADNETYAVDYANPDTRTVVVYSTYQMDQSVV